jgi:excinuclease ABC subunit A
MIIEHNLDVIRNADWIIDMGPEGGEDGGRVIAEGRPTDVAAVPGSFTGQFLAKYYAEHGAPAEAPTEIVAAPEPVSSRPPRAAKKATKAAVERPKGPRQKKTGKP